MQVTRDHCTGVKCWHKTIRCLRNGASHMAHDNSHMHIMFLARAANTFKLSTIVPSHLNSHIISHRDSPLFLAPTPTQAPRHPGRMWWARTVLRTITDFFSSKKNVDARLLEGDVTNCHDLITHPPVDQARHALRPLPSRARARAEGDSGAQP